MGSGATDPGVGGRGRAAPWRPAWLMGWLARLRADLTRPAMDLRILHRLSTLSDRELRGIGLVRADIHDARRAEAGDVSAFLIVRRDARRELRRRLSEPAARQGGQGAGSRIGLPGS